MKRTLIVVLLALSISRASAGNAPQTIVPDMKRYIEYLAGIELLTNDRTHGQKVCAERYRKLCVCTGVDAVSAESFVRRYRDKPGEWQNVQGKVLELLQSIK